MEASASSVRGRIPIGCGNREEGGGDMRSVATVVNSMLSRVGLEVRRSQMRIQAPVESTADDLSIVDRCRPFTMTSESRLWSLLAACRYISANQISGDVVECGVWRGGSAMAMALAFKDEGDVTRAIWLYDTFSGMTEPSAVDINLRGQSAKTLFDRRRRLSGGAVDWAFADQHEVERNLASTGWPRSQTHLVEGDVCRTLRAGETPEKIALLRLDTDWYASTAAELEILYPKLVPGGVCIIDDYGHWEGARRAVDEYLRANELHPFMQCPDYSARVWIKA